MLRNLLAVALTALCIGCGDAENGNQRTFKGSADQDSGEGDNPSNDDANPVDPNDPGTIDPSGFSGSMLSVSAVGVIEGWAVNTKDLTQNVFVIFYIDGDSSSGQDGGSTTANLVGFDGNNQGNHRFSYTLPAQFRDGEAHKVTAYMETPDGDVAIKTGAKPFTAYLASTAGTNYYNANILGRVQGDCSSCHGVTEVALDNHFAKLLDPSPADGGTASNNRLYIKASGGMNHGGGNRCGSVAGLCANIQTWWTTEFGN